MSEDDIVIREATEGDIVGITYVQATSWIKNYQNKLAKISEDDIRSVNFEAKLSEWHHVLKSPNYRTWVAAEGENILAFITAIKDSAGVEIYQQHTLPDHQRQGLGERLINQVKEWANKTPISLRVPVYIESAQDFYQKHGFAIDEEGEVDFIRLPSGKQIPTVMLRTSKSPAPTVETPEPHIPLAEKTVAQPIKATPRPVTRNLVGRTELAKLSGTRASTIKYYTEVGILPFVQADSRLARRYKRARALKRLEEITKLRQNGLTIVQIQQHFAQSE